MRNNSEGLAAVTAPSQNLSSNYGHGAMGKKQPKVILSSAAGQQMQASFGNQNKNSHILMNNHHVKMKTGANKATIQSTQMNMSPTQEERKVLGAKETVQAVQGQHK